MSANKQQKERDKAVKHLMDYIHTSDEWAPLFGELIRQFMTPVASHFEEESDQVTSRLMDSPYGDMAFGFLFEQMATTSWDNESLTPIDAYLKQRGWREGAHGRRYLRAMQDAELAFLEVTRVEPGRWVEVRPFGTETQPMRVIERGASESLHTWDALVARVITEGKTRRFTGAIVPLSPLGSSALAEQLDAVPADLAGWYQEMVEEGDVEGVPVNLVNEIPMERQRRVTEYAFSYWAIEALEGPTTGTPQMFTTDNERVVMTSFRFPVLGDKAQIREQLTQLPALVNDTDDTWSWLKSDGSNTVLGRLSLEDEHLLFNTNSVERGQRGVDLIQSLLGDAWVGPPIGVHENLEDLLSSMPADQTFDPNDADLQQLPEVQAMVQQHLMEHYRRTLDEPIPMLDNESPRACAADPDKRKKVVAWLKTLENMDDKSPTPAQDFQWMWDELGLTSYKPAYSD